MLRIIVQLDFRALFSRVLADLKLFIGTQNDVLVLTASGTGFMEAAVFLI